MPNAGPLSLLIPSIVLLGSLATLPYTIIQLALSNRTSTLSSWSQIRHAWFKHFCDWFGPNSKPLFAPRVNPLLAQAKGIVLDIGPANGDWMDELAKAYKAGGITKIYGVEPNAEFHEPLRQAAKKAGMTDVYEVVGAKAQDLEAWGVEKGSVDTVLTVHVLCSVGPKADEITRALYEMLKPGGQWLVYEHVGARHGVTKMFQSVYNLVWGTLLDECHLTRNTGQAIKAAGEWDSTSLEYDPREGYFECLPHVIGRLVKKTH